MTIFHYSFCAQMSSRIVMFTVLHVLLTVNIIGDPGPLTFNMPVMTGKWFCSFCYLALKYAIVHIIEIISFPIIIKV